MIHQIFESLTEGEKKQLAKGIVPVGLKQTLKDASVSENALIEIAKKSFKIKESPKFHAEKNASAHIEEVLEKGNLETEKPPKEEEATQKQEDNSLNIQRKMLSARERIDKLASLNALVAQHSALKNKQKDFEEIMLISDDTISNLHFKRGDKTFEVKNAEVVKEALELVGLRLTERITKAESVIEAFEI